MAQKYGRDDLNPIKRSAAEKSLRTALLYHRSHGMKHPSDG